MSKQRFNWQLKDILMIAIAGVLFSFLYLGIDYVGLAITSALTPLGWGAAGYEPFYGIYFMAASFAIYIIQKPGVGIVAEVIAATLEVLWGNWFGPSVIFTGLLQGLFVEIGFMIFRYRRYDTVSMILGAISVGGLSFLYHFFESEFNLLPPHISLTMLVIRVLSSILFTGIIAKLLADGLARAGVLNAYALGRKRLSDGDLEVN